MSEQGIEPLLDMVDGLYRKYGVELDAEDTATAQAARNALLATPPVPAGEVEVTPAMLEAGEIAWQAWGHAEPVDLAIRRIYLAMRRATLSSPSSDSRELRID